jgi:hypothetical protein
MSWSERYGKRTGLSIFVNLHLFSVFDDALIRLKLYSTINVPLLLAYLLGISMRVST